MKNCEEEVSVAKKLLDIPLDPYITNSRINTDSSNIGNFAELKKLLIQERNNQEEK